MSLIVQKFGGSSVADGEKLLQISQIIRTERDTGNDVIVVVSAQGDTTDRLLALAEQVAGRPDRRELDALLAAGEQVSAALTAMTLCFAGVRAVSLAAWQLPICSDGPHGDARIDCIRTERVEAELRRGRVVVVAGFQGTNAAGDLTTLGRGGSDYTAVALAAAFHAAECRIYTDVDGVYTADPRLCPGARRLRRVSYEDMYALSRAGAQVLHDKCVSLAQERGVEPVVLSCSGGEGTRVGPAGERRRVTGVTRRRSETEPLAAVTLVGEGLPSLAAQKTAILALDAAGITVRGVDAAPRTLTLYVDREHSDEALRAVHAAVVEPEENRP